MINSIIHCYENEKIASIYCDLDDSEKHYTGYIKKVDETSFLIAHITPHGFYDGYILRGTEEVYRIDYESEYEKKIEKLYKFRNQSHNLSIPNEVSLFYSVLKSAKQNSLIVSFIFENSHISGFVKNYDENLIYINCVNDNGFEDGFSVINIDDVLILEVDTEYEQDLNLLHTNQG